MSRTTLIHLPNDIHDRLQELADKRQTSLESALDYALSMAERQSFWDQMRTSHDQDQSFLEADVEAWADTYCDGLINEDWSDIKMPSDNMEFSQAKGSHHYRVTATRSNDLWELAVSGVGTTQSENVSQADEMIRDLIEILTDTNADNAEITIEWRIHEAIDAEVAAARAARTEANHRHATAEHKIHATAVNLSRHGIDHRDIASLLQISDDQVEKLLANPT